MASGYGRGGRGAALLEALKAPVRKPGESDKHEKADDQPQVGARPMPMGRGALLQQALLQQQQKSSGPGQPALAVGRGAVGRGVPIVSSAPVGRGAPIGRGAPLSSQSEHKPVGRGIPPISTHSQQVPRPAAHQTVSSPDVQSPARSSRASPPAQSPPQQVHPSATDSGDSRPSRLEHMLERISLESDAVTRRGKFGSVCELTANYIRVKCNNEGVFQYAVAYKPPVDSIGLRKKLLYQHEDVIGSVRAFDGAILFLPIRLPQSEVNLKSEKPLDKEDVQVTVKMVKILPPESCIQLYNVILRNIMRILKMCPVGRHHYDPHRPAQVPQHRLEVWPGYVTSVRQYEGGLMLLTDVSHKVLRTETALDYMQDIFQKKPQDFQGEVYRRLVGLTVLTRYNNKTYRVDDIAWDQNPMSTFGTSKGEVTFLEYYRKNYGKEIQDCQQPLLLHKPKKREQAKAGRRPALEVICLIPELCYMTGLTDEMRANFTVMKDLQVHTKVTPSQRQLSFRKFLDNVNSHPEARAELAKWGLQLDTDTIQLQGRQLPPEKIRLQKGIHTSRNADWTNSFRDDGVISAVDLRCWAVVSTQRDTQRATGFISMMEQVCPNLGISVNRPQVVPIPNDRTDTYLTAIRSHIHADLQVVVIIFPTSRDDRYNAVKKLCCVENPVPSQVIITRTISKEPGKLRSIVQKIALQINCKLGGELWAVDIPGKKIMVVGIDVYHDSAKGGKSIGAFVASMNESCTRWYSKTCFQLPKQELIDGLKIIFTSAIKKFHAIRHELPERIIVYRDGVGDGDLPYVQEHEAKQLAECFPAFGEAYQPKMGFIVVQKRINTRLFLRMGRGQHAKLDNPPPGTVCDHTVTRRDMYDFFLVSQLVRQGTVSPTHYIVVHDDFGWDVDKVQRLSYKMTHLYYNWPGTVRVPAPCQYAHKLAYLVGQNLHKDPSPLLADRLFYL